MWSHKFYLPFDIKPIISKGKNLNSPKHYNLLVTSHTCACHWPTKVTWPVGHVTWEWGREGRREGERLADGSIPLKKIARDCTTTHDSRTLQLRDYISPVGQFNDNHSVKLDSIICVRPWDFENIVFNRLKLKLCILQQKWVYLAWSCLASRNGPQKVDNFPCEKYLRFISDI